jgi:glutathione S-transferase
MRARMALLLAEQPFEVFEIVLRDKPAAMLALSPKGTVPVQQLPDGQVLEQSLDIMRWALGSDDREGCWSRAQSPENLALIDCNDSEFKRHLDRYKYPERHATEGLTREVHRSQAVELLLMPLQRRLQEERYLGDDAPCAADLAIFPFVRQFSAVEPAWFASQPLPALQAWLQGWLGSRLFEACMVKLPQQQRVSFPQLRS